MALDKAFISKISILHVYPYYFSIKRRICKNCLILKETSTVNNSQLVMLLLMLFVVLLSVQAVLLMQMQELYNYQLYTDYTEGAAVVQ